MKARKEKIQARSNTTKSLMLSLFIIASLSLSLPLCANGQKLNSSIEKSYSSIVNTKYASWGIDPKSKASINIVDAWKKFTKKKEIVVAVIDTGVDPTHPFLADNIYLPNQKKTSTSSFGVDFSKNRKDQFRPLDTHGHGTHVAGIVKSIFPDVKLLILKYYNPSASGQDNLNSTIEALKFAIDSNVDIINYSGGGPEPAIEELKAMKLAEKKGILVVAAAGNDEQNIDNKAHAYYPASYGLSNIITVTAHDEYKTILPSSNYGMNSVDLGAPGDRILSSTPQGRASYLTGTSQATAFVTGVAALIKSNYPELGPQEIRRVIYTSAKKESGLFGKCASGGRLDAKEALTLAQKEYSKGIKPIREIATKPGKIIYRKK